MAKNSRILLIDDDESILRTISSILEEKGYEVDTASNAEEALKKAESIYYNLALIDIRLPDIEGTDLLSRLQKISPEMIKIILTGYPSLHNAVRAVNRGADGYLIKPADPDTLQSMIKEHLRRQEEMRKYSEEKVTEFIEARAKELKNAFRKKRPPKSRDDSV
jgi:DNA-binding NtrC family response regulator